MKICIVGLGYVGLPLAHLLADKFEVHGYDISKEKIALFKGGQDPTHEIGEAIKSTKIKFHDDPKIISNCNFIIIAVPTPITDDYQPNIKPVVSATELVAKYLSRNSIISYESTVYPGLTEEICLPIIEKITGFKLGIDFKLVYSPERVNPGDKEHTIDKIVKVISGSDKEALDAAERVYGSITRVHKASSLKVAEAAKVIENVQRDLNIALMNELSIIFHKIGIDTNEVIEAAATKWNFQKYTPGLVGGHCIGVDPYYLTYKSNKMGYIPQIILAGRALNENMVKEVTNRIIKRLSKASKPLHKTHIHIFGLTFKEDVNDLRNSKIKNLIYELQQYNINITGYDPMVNEAELRNEGFEIEISASLYKEADLIIIGSPHKKLIPYFDQINVPVFDIKGKFKDKFSKDNYMRL